MLKEMSADLYRKKMDGLVETMREIVGRTQQDANTITSETNRVREEISDSKEQIDSILSSFEDGSYQNEEKVRELILKYMTNMLREIRQNPNDSPIDIVSLLALSEEEKIQVARGHKEFYVYCNNDRRGIKRPFSKDFDGTYRSITNFARLEQNDSLRIDIPTEVYMSEPSRDGVELRINRGSPSPLRDFRLNPGDIIQFIRSGEEDMRVDIAYYILARKI